MVAKQQPDRSRAVADSSLGRGLEILAALGSDDATAAGGLGAVRIARLLGRETSQVSRALRTLSESGLVQRDPDSRDYRLGWELFTLAMRARDRRLIDAAGPLLEGLRARLGETAHLSLLDGPEVVTIVSMVPASAVRVSDWSGRRVPAYCTSSGRALLFDHDRPMLDALFPGGTLPAQGTGAPLDVAELHRRIAAARIRGYALVDQEFQPGLVGIAAPVRDFRGAIVAALNVSAPKFRSGAQLEVEGGLAVKRAAVELSRQLGWANDRERRTGGEHV